MTYKSEFLKICAERGFIHQLTNAAGLDALLSKPGAIAYIGFDCTARSLHVGSLVQIMILRWLQKCGHKPLVLMGGGTTKIGDPSGKDEARKMLSASDITENKQGIASVFAKFLTFGGGVSDAVMLDNAEWLDGLHYIDFLRDYGRHFSVNRMLTMESVKMRLEREQNLSFLEFNYMILQAYDFAELFKRHSCRVQIGGSDQWGNIVNGIDLGRRLHETELFGLTTPLLTTASGAKMGKTADGAVWMNADMLSPYNYWQFWRNTDDADVGKFLRLFTDISLDEISRLEQLGGAEINEAKKRLADEATALCHGLDAAMIARQTAEQTFEQGGVSENLPTVEITQAALPAFELFFQAGLCESKSEARKLIRGGGAKINDEKISDENQIIALNPSETLKLSAGKKKHVLAAFR
jgi:tyrosyl-tRNA synthetase